jgi:hypothetical protein
MSGMAEFVGGIGIGIMMHRDPFTIELEGLAEHYRRMCDKFEKNTAGPIAKFADAPLRKRGGGIDYGALLADATALRDSVSELRKSLAEATRREAACNAKFPAFRAWVSNQPNFERQINIFEPRQPAIDPGAALDDAVMRHRYNHRRET